MTRRLSFRQFSRRVGLEGQLLVSAALLALAGTVSAQSTTATLSGVVIDESNAVVPGVNVTVFAKSTGVQRESATGADGQFTFPALQPGRYSVRAEMSGFTPVQVTDLTLNVNDNVSIRLQLKVGAVDEAVSVVAEPSRVDRTPAVGTVFDRRDVSTMPLNGRTFQALIALTPGAVLTTSTATRPGQFSVNGQRTDTNYFTVDGVGANFGISSNVANAQGFAGTQPALNATGGTAGLVSLDALEEFKVQTSSYAPEFGRGPGAQVQIVTRSGSNSLSGSAFEYFRDEAMDANDWFANRAGTGKPKLGQHDFGGVLGGPVLTDRLFYFASYERLAVDQPQVLVGSVPSLETRASAADVVRPLLDAFPRPNGPAAVNPLTGQLTGLAEFTSAHTDRITSHAFSGRVDYRPSRTWTAFGRVSYAPSESRTRLGASSIVSTGKLDTVTATGGMNLFASGSLVNEVRVNYSRQDGASRFALDDWGGAVVPADALLFPSFASPTTGSASVIVRLDGTTTQAVTGTFADNAQEQINVVDALSWVRGHHTMKFGFDFRQLTAVRGPSEYQLNMNFTTLADLRNGRVSSTFRTTNDPTRPVYRNYSLFAQDTWSLHPELTLTLGVRWDVNPSPTESSGREAITILASNDPAAFAPATRGTRLFDTVYSGVGPRAGVSYRFNTRDRWSTVLRGGAGLFYDIGANEINRAYAAFPFKAEVSGPAAAFPLSPSDAARPVLPTLSAPPYVGTFVAYDENFELPRTAQWNAGITQELGRSRSIWIGYVGARGSHLLRQEVRSAPNSNFPGSVTIIRSDAESSYHALQLELTQRLAAGMQARASYTLSEAKDDVSDALTSARLRGPADFDVRHALSAAATYTIPARPQGLFGALARDWSIDVITRWRTGFPMDVIARRSVAFDGVLVDVRPNFLEGIPVYLDDPLAPGGKRLNNTTDPSRPGCLGPFCTPPAGQQGNLGRNAVRGLSATQLDLAIRRSIPTRAGQIVFGVEAFNVLNHPNFGPLDGLMTSARFGQASAMLGRSLGGVSPIHQVGGPRSIQLSARFAF